MKQADTNKILTKIRKLLAMAADASSPNEAAIAAGQARKLMDKHQITDLDLEKVKPNQFGTDVYDTRRKVRVIPQASLAGAVGKLNDCIVMYAKNPETGRLNVTFSGLKADATCAAIMMEWLNDKMYSFIPGISGKKAYYEYQRGFAAGIWENVKTILKEREEIKTSSGTALVVCKMVLVSEKYGEQQYSKKKTTKVRFTEAWERGHVEALNTSLNQQVDAGQKRLG